MRALSIPQPGPWFIFHGYPPKFYLNVDWSEEFLKEQLALCPIGSNFLIHAAPAMTGDEYKAACEFALKKCSVFNQPQPADLHRGGIVGLVKLKAVVRFSSSPWFTGPLALVLSEPYPLPFQPCKGQLGFFDWDTRDYREKHVAPVAPTL